MLAEAQPKPNRAPHERFSCAPALRARRVGLVHPLNVICSVGEIELLETQGFLAVKGRPRLGAKQQRFVKEFLVDLNAMAAARRAGYSTKSANTNGPRLLVSFVGSSHAWHMRF